MILTMTTMVCNYYEINMSNPWNKTYQIFQVFLTIKMMTMMETEYKTMRFYRKIDNIIDNNWRMSRTRIGSAMMKSDDVEIFLDM